MTALDWLAAAALLAGGALVFARRRDPRLAIAGVAWLAGTLAPDVSFLLTLHRGPLVHAALSHPDGRLRGHAARAVVAFAWVDGAVPALAGSAVLTLLLAVAVTAVGIGVARRTRGPQRLARRVGAAAGVLAVAAPAAGAVLSLAGAGGESAVVAFYDGCVIAVAALLARRPSTAVSELVIDLGRSGGTLRRALAHALGDPELAVLFRSGDGHVDGAGRAVAPESVPGRIVTELTHRGEPVGAIVHDAAVLDDPSLVRSVAASAAVAVDNVRLRARVRAQIASIEASRGRLVEAAAEQRRHLAAQLDATVVRELTEVGRSLEGIEGAALARAELELALDDVRQIAAELAPPRPALHELLDDRLRTLPLDIDLYLDERPLPADVDVALGYVATEAIANTVKHAQASRLHIALEIDGSLARLAIADDGAGGADPAGHGLAGIAARVRELGGRLEVTSAPRVGTTVRAEVPLASSAVAGAA